MTTALTIQQRFEATKLWETVGYHYISAENGRAKLTLPFDETLVNTGGSMHGGIIMMTLDNVMGMATMTLGFDQVLTIQMETRFIRQAENGLLTATAQVIEQTRSTVITEGKIFNEDGEMVAMCTATFKGLVFSNT